VREKKYRKKDMSQEGVSSGKREKKLSSSALFSFHLTFSSEITHCSPFFKKKSVIKHLLS
jgi:hypothetical protein